MALSLGDIKKFLKSDAATSMARQALGIPADGEHGATSGPPDIPVNLPSPVRTITTNPQQPAIAAPLPGIPPPTRVSTSDIGEPPPPPAPAYINNMENVNRNLRVPGNLSEATGSPLTGIEGATFNPINPDIPAPRRAIPTAEPMPVASGAPTIPPPTRVFMGERTGTTDESGNQRAPLTPAEKAAAHVRALQADPSQSVKETPEGYEIGPPHKMSHLKAAGKMFLQRMLAGSQYGLGGMLGAGIEGAIEGGVAPGHAQAVLRDAQRQKAIGDQYQAQQIERQGLQNQAQTLNIEQDQQALIDAPRRRAMQEEDRTNAQYERERADLDQMAGAVGNQRSDDPNRQKNLEAIQTEADRLSQKYGRAVRVIPGEGKAPPRIVVDGEVLQENPDGTLKSIYGSPKTDRTNEYHDADVTHSYQEKLGEIQGKRAASLQAAQAEEDRAKNYQEKVNQAAAQLSVLDANMAKMPAQIPDPGGAKMADGVTPKMVPNPELGPLKRQREQFKQQQAQAQKGMEEAYKTRDTHKAKAAEFVDPPPPPTRSKKPSDKQALSKAAWMNSHPGGDWNTAQAEATRRQIPIIP